MCLHAGEVADGAEDVVKRLDGEHMTDAWNDASAGVWQERDEIAGVLDGDETVLRAVDDEGWGGDAP